MNNVAIAIAAKAARTINTISQVFKPDDGTLLVGGAVVAT